MMFFFKDRYEERKKTVISELDPKFQKLADVNIKLKTEVRNKSESVSGLVKEHKAEVEKIADIIDFDNVRQTDYFNQTFIKVFNGFLESVERLDRHIPSNFFPKHEVDRFEFADYKLRAFSQILHNVISRAEWYKNVGMPVPKSLKTTFLEYCIKLQREFPEKNTWMHELCRPGYYGDYPHFSTIEREMPAERKLHDSVAPRLPGYDPNTKTIRFYPTKFDGNTVISQDHLATPFYSTSPNILAHSSDTTMLIGTLNTATSSQTVGNNFISNDLSLFDTISSDELSLYSMIIKLIFILLCGLLAEYNRMMIHCNFKLFTFRLKEFISSLEVKRYKILYFISFIYLFIPIFLIVIFMI